MQNHKGFRRFICVTVLCALLMVFMGRATRVSAVGTTAAIAGTAFVLTGAVYLSYVALTHGQLVLPAADELHDYLGDIGRKVSQYSSGHQAYQEIYQGLLNDPTANVIDGIWTWTQDRLKSFANDFSDTRIIYDLSSYDRALEFVPPALPYDYGVTFNQFPNVFYYNGELRDLSYFTNDGYNLLYPTGIRVGRIYGDQSYIIPTTLEGTYRNVYNGSRYSVQKLVDGVWTPFSLNRVNAIVHLFNGSDDIWFTPILTLNYYSYTNYEYLTDLSYTEAPVLVDSPLYNSVTGETTEVIPQESTEVVGPSWTNPDNDNRPIIPFVPIPQLPSNISPPDGFTGISQWGFNLQDLLDKLEDLAGQLIDIGGIATLINEFAGLHGDNYYIEYNDGDTNYYTYYQPTIFDNDTEYVTYNIDISEHEDVIPVDLNTISLYTKNEYLDAVKQSARNFGDAIGEYVAFWHNSDYTLTYTILGGFVLILIGAFIGKWGHS